MLFTNVYVKYKQKELNSMNFIISGKNIEVTPDSKIQSNRN